MDQKTFILISFFALYSKKRFTKNKISFTIKHVLVSINKEKMLVNTSARVK